MARRAVLCAFVGGALAALAGCGLGGGGSYRFRLTVEVETPQGLRTGSGVMRASAHRTLKLTSEESAHSGGLKGEAVVVDLPGGPLFVLLKLPDARGSLDAKVTVALDPEAAQGGDAYMAAVRRLGGWFGGPAKADLPRADWPMMVRFANIDDPRTVERVDPAVIGVKRIVLAPAIPTPPVSRRGSGG
ncbi:MAG: hypothetical protein P8Y48_16895 [Novosphingobium sp.]